MSVFVLAIDYSLTPLFSIFGMVSPFFGTVTFLSGSTNELLFLLVDFFKIDIGVSFGVISAIFSDFSAL